MENMSGAAEAVRMCLQLFGGAVRRGQCGGGVQRHPSTDILDHVCKSAAMGLN